MKTELKTNDLIKLLKESLEDKNLKKIQVLENKLLKLDENTKSKIIQLRNHFDVKLEQQKESADFWRNEYFDLLKRVNELDKGTEDEN